MNSYVLRRLLLIIPTLLGIMTINFFIVQIAPGGPVEQAIAQYQGLDSANNSRIASGNNSDIQSSSGESKYRGAQGVDPNILQLLKSYMASINPL